MKENVKKLFVYTFPYVGHTNPVLGFCKELKKNYKNLKTTVYSTKNYQSLIEQSGAKYKEYETNKFVDQSEDANVVNDLSFVKIAVETIDIANELANKLCEEALKERPDMIAYDKSTLYGKLIIDHILIEYKKRNLKPFKIIGYSTTLLTDREYPNENEKKLFNFTKMDLIWLFVFMIKKLFFYLTRGVFKKFSLISTYDPLDNETTIVFTFPQLQPRSEFKDKTIFKFIGCCFDEKLHSSGRDYTNDECFSLIEKFPLKTNNSISMNTTNSYDLIYVAFGSVLTNQMNVYLRIINGLDLVNKQKPIKVIISTGSKCYDYLMMKRDEFKIGDYVYLMKSAPQIDILKRASLFITHNGMNSTSESIHFGVPMICMPMTTDQPLVAFRVANELKLGIKLDYKTFSSIELKQAVLDIFNDKSYYHRCQIYKNYSRDHNGILNAARLINEIINS